MGRVVVVGAPVRGVSRRRRAVDEPIKRLHPLSNRVAHHEPLLNIDLLARCDDVLTLAGLILPELRSYIAATTSCPKLLAQRP